jgi:two-component SAPR family response regulator
MNSQPLAGTSVLIVEDTHVVADALRYLIDGYGGSVSAIVPSLPRAFEALAAGPVDIAVLDINLNGTCVVPLAEQLRTLGIPFVFLSGYSEEELLPEHLRAHPRLDKPVEAERLVRAMLHLTRRLPS